MGLGIGLDILEKRKIFYLCQESHYDSGCIEVIMYTLLYTCLYLYAVVYSVLRHPFLSKCGGIDVV